MGTRKVIIAHFFLQVCEALSIAGLSATMGFLMIYYIKDCKPLGQDPTNYPIQMHCQEGEYSAVAALWFQTPEKTVRSLLHDPKGINLLIHIVLHAVSIKSKHQFNHT